MRQVLVSLVLCNAALSAALPLCLDRLLSPLAAILISSTAVVVFSEILPQAIFSRCALMCTFTCRAACGRADLHAACARADLPSEHGHMPRTFTAHAPAWGRLSTQRAHTLHRGPASITPLLPPHQPTPGTLSRSAPFLRRYSTCCCGSSPRRPSPSHCCWTRRSASRGRTPCLSARSCAQSSRCMRQRVSARLHAHACIVCSRAAGQRARMHAQRARGRSRTSMPPCKPASAPTPSCHA